MITYRIYRYIKMILLILCFLTIVKTSEAAIKWIDIGVNGLTCSMCTRSVEMRIRRLDFVSTVEMDLETANGRIFFKEGVGINLDKIAQAVREAGFSLQYYKITFDLDDVSITPGGEFMDHLYSFQWVGYTASREKKTVILRIMNDGFLPKAESKTFFEKGPGIKMKNHRSLYYVVEEK